MWLHSLKVAQLLRSAACLHTNQSRSYLNHLVHVVMLLHVSALQSHLQATLFKDSHSLYTNYKVFLRYAVCVPSYLFELWLFLCRIRCVVFRCAYQALPELMLLICCIIDGKRK
jgi:hypothetical protein